MEDLRITTCYGLYIFICTCSAPYSTSAELVSHKHQNQQLLQYRSAVSDSNVKVRSMACGQICLKFVSLFVTLNPCPPALSSLNVLHLRLSIVHWTADVKKGQDDSCASVASCRCETLSHPPSWAWASSEPLGSFSRSCFLETQWMYCHIKRWITFNQEM